MTLSNFVGLSMISTRLMSIPMSSTNLNASNGVFVERGYRRNTIFMPEGASGKYHILAVPSNKACPKWSMMHPPKITVSLRETMSSSSTLYELSQSQFACSALKRRRRPAMKVKFSEHTPPSYTPSGVLNSGFWRNGSMSAFSYSCTCAWSISCERQFVCHFFISCTNKFLVIIPHFALFS